MTAFHPDTFFLTQAAVAAVKASQHETNKIAASLSGCDAGFSLTRCNDWPAPILEKIGKDVRIGNASGTVHAETSCILAAPQATAGASIFVTDPPCPNCMKNMAEAGIKALYIDHKGFGKDFATRRGGDFEDISLKICAAAGIAVYKVFRKENRIETMRDATPLSEDFTRGLYIFETPPPKRGAVFDLAIQAAQAHFTSTPFVVAGLHNGGWLAAAATGPADEMIAKYSLRRQPLARVLMNAARLGRRVHPDFLYTSRVPTSRELVDMVAAGISKIRIGNPHDCRDEFGPAALRQLVGAGIVIA